MITAASAVVVSTPAAISAPVVPASTTPTPPGVGANVPARWARKNTRKNSVTPSSEPTPSARNATSRITAPQAWADMVRARSPHGRRPARRRSRRTSATPDAGSCPSSAGTRRASTSHNFRVRPTVHVSSRSERSTTVQNARDPTSTALVTPSSSRSVVSAGRCVRSSSRAKSGRSHVANVVAIP